MVDAQKPFYSENPKIQKVFPNFGKNTAALLKHARKNGFLVVHVRAVYNESVSPWISNFRRLNKGKLQREINPKHDLT